LKVGFDYAQPTVSCSLSVAEGNNCKTNFKNYKFKNMKKVKLLITTIAFSCAIASFGQEARLNKTNNVRAGAIIHEQAIESIIASNKVTESSNVHYEAGKYVLMLPGFKADNKAVFQANIADVASQPQSVEINSIMIKGNPNPFLNISEIQFSLPQTGKASMVVYSELGVPVAKIFNDEHFEKGSYSRRFIGEHLTAGLYLVSLADDFGNKATIKLEKR
jgi:hypothetical protein